MTEYEANLKAIYDPAQFKALATRTVEYLSGYLQQCLHGNDFAVLPNISPDNMLQNWSAPFPAEGKDCFAEMISKTIDFSNHLHHPRFLGHQVTAPLPAAALCELVGTFLNNSTAIYEMAPANTAMEYRLIEWMAGRIGYDENSSGFFTSGGTIGNLTALLAARQAKAGYNVWTEGIKEGKDLTVLVSEQAHYSIQRAVAIMGLGQEAAIAVSADQSFRLDMAALHKTYAECVRKGSKVIAVVANACSTATGSFDNIERLAEFCRENDLWLHVDAAHGASVLLSDKYSSLLAGIEYADSVVWDAHKMLLMPALITAVLFKDGAHSYSSFNQEASYLFSNQAEDEWYNYAHRTMECTKNMVGMKLYITLMTYGTRFFGQYVDSRITLTRAFADVIKESDDFEFAVKPESNIICFRYNPPAYSGSLDELQQKVREAVLGSEQFYLVQAYIKGACYLRSTIINPHTTLEHLKELLAFIRTRELF